MESSNVTTTNSIDVESPAETSDSSYTEAHENDDEQHDSLARDGGGTQQQNSIVNTCLLLWPLLVIFIFAALAIVTGDFVGPMVTWACFATFVLCLIPFIGSSHNSSTRGSIAQRDQLHSCHPVTHFSKEKMMKLLIPIQAPHQNDNNGEWCCDICLNEEREVNGKVVASPNPECSHMFHQGCIIHWLECHRTCPCCRAEYLPSTMDEDNHSSSLHDTEHGGDDHQFEEGDGGDVELMTVVDTSNDRL